MFEQFDINVRFFC